MELVTGRVLEIYEEEGLPMAKVSVGGAIRRVCLAYLPGIQVGDHVLIHAGVALAPVRGEGGGDVSGHSGQGRRDL